MKIVSIYFSTIPLPRLPESRLSGDLCLTCADETTAIGEPKPGPVGRVQSRVVPVQAAGTGSSLLGMVAAGAGIGLVFSVIGRIF